MNEPASASIDLFHTSACLCTALRRASRTLSAAYDQAVSKAGLTSSQFFVLHRLAETGPVSIKALAKAVGVDRTTLSRTVALLSERGLIAGSTEGDRRIKWISITARGRAAIERASTGWLDVQRATIEKFGAGRTEDLLQALEALAGSAALPTNAPKNEAEG